MTELIFGQPKPRRIMNTIMEYALLDATVAGADNDRVRHIQEAYSYLDRVAMQANGAVPASSVQGLNEAITVADFPHYFARVLSRAVYERYNSKRGQWQDYCFMDLVPDYTKAERFRFSEFDRPVRRREKEEASAGYIYESDPVELQADDYAKQIDFSRRIFKNDDMGAFNNVLQKMADSTQRMRDWYVSALYDNALSQAGLIALGAMYAGTGRLTTANLAIALNAFVQRVDGRNNPINVSATYLVVHPVLNLVANQILMSEHVAELATNGINPIRNALQIRNDPYIAFAGLNIPWYLFAAPADVPTVTVARMSGKESDFYLYIKAPDKMSVSTAGAIGAADWRDGSFLTGDMAFLVETTIGNRVDDPGVLVGITDANGIYYSSGTTP